MEERRVTLNLGFWKRGKWMEVFLLRNARGRDFLVPKGRFGDGKGRLFVSNNMWGFIADLLREFLERKETSARRRIFSREEITAGRTSSHGIKI
jgi:hypothetical protein